MRTTITLDPDVAALVERVVAARRQRFKDVVNSALRLGLAQFDAPEAPQAPFRTASVSLGGCRMTSLDNIAEALAVEHGLLLCSTDGDFARFAGLNWKNPIRGPS